MAKAKAAERAPPLRKSFQSFRLSLYRWVYYSVWQLRQLTIVYLQLDVSTKRRCISATTLKLRQISDRISGSLNEIFLLTDALLRELLLELVSDLGSIYKLREITSTLDMLCSFAEVPYSQIFLATEILELIALNCVGCCRCARDQSIDV